MSGPPKPLAARPLESLGSTSLSLVEGIRKREPEAWRRLVDLFTPPIYGYCRRCGLQESDAAEVVQQTLCEVFEGIDAFRWDDSTCTLRGWIWKIAKRKFVDHLRQQARRPRARGGSTAQEQLEQVAADAIASVEGQSQDDEPRAEGDFTRALAKRAAELVRAEFEEKTWLAFAGTVIEGRATADVAADLGMTKEAVRKAKSRVLRRLRKELDGIL